MKIGISTAIVQSGQSSDGPPAETFRLLREDGGVMLREDGGDILREDAE